MRRVSLALAVALLVGAGAGTALTAADVYVFGVANTKSERQIQRLLDKAIDRVERDRSCRRPQPPPTTFSDDPPSTRLLATLGILRRPQNADERLPDDAFEGFHLDGVHRGHVRVARSASGPDFLVVPVRDLDSSKPRPRRCTAELRRRFGRLIGGRPARFKRKARGILDEVIRTLFDRPEGKPVEGLYLFERDRDGLPGSGGGGDVTGLRRWGSFDATSARPGGRSPRSNVHVLVPDGVASVTAVYPRIARRGRIQKPRRYPSRVTRSSLVRDNVVSYVVPRAIQDSYPLRFVWRSADGRVVKVLRTPR